MVKYANLIAYRLLREASEAPLRGGTRGHRLLVGEGQEGTEADGTILHDNTSNRNLQFTVFSDENEWCTSTRRMMELWKGSLASG